MKIPFPKTREELEAILIEHVVKDAPPDWHPLSNVDHFEGLLTFCQHNLISVEIVAPWGESTKRVIVEHGGKTWSNHWKHESAAASASHALVYALLGGCGIEFES